MNVFRGMHSHLENALANLVAGIGWSKAVKIGTSHIF